MTAYEDKEASVAEGQPYFLYLFDNGVDKVRLTSDAESLVRNPEGLVEAPRFRRSPIRHSTIEQTGAIEQQSLDFIFPLSDPFAQTLRAFSMLVTSVKVWRGHHSDGTNTLEVVWNGRLVDCVDTDQAIRAVGETIFTSMRRPGCRARVQRPCRHVHYRPGCNLNRADFAVPTTVTAADGLVLTVPVAADEPDGRYKAGIIDLDGMLATISKHTGSTLTLLNQLAGLAAAIAAGPVSVTIAPGCALNTESCAFFNNNLNFGGFEDMVNENPFEHSIV